MKALLIAAGVSLALALTVLLPAMATQAEERAAWAEQSARLGHDDYSAERSDRHHGASEQARLRVRVGGGFLGLALVLFAAGWRQPVPQSGGAPASTTRRALVTVIDGGVGWLVFGLAIAGDATRLWDTMDSAWASALEAMAPALLVLPHAALLHGRSLGLRVVGCRFESTKSRAFWAVLLAPLSLPVLLLTLPALRRFPRLSAVHLGSGIKMNGHSKSGLTRIAQAPPAD